MNVAGYQEGAALPMKRPLRLEMKLRNNRLIRAREELGYSAPTAAKAMGVSYHSLVRLESLHLSPLRSDGTWRGVALKIAAFFNEPAEFLWPEDALSVERTCATLELDAAEAAMLAGALAPPALQDESIALAQLQAALADSIGKLTPKETMVIQSCVVDEMTFEEMGSVLGVGRERVRQILGGALRKLRHPRLLGPILEAVDGTRAL